jgi:hypothetical protein
VEVVLLRLDLNHTLYPEIRAVGNIVEVFPTPEEFVMREISILSKDRDEVFLFQRVSCYLDPLSLGYVRVQFQLESSLRRR